MTQLSFTAIFAAEAFENQTAHLPAAMQEAVPYFWQLIERNNAAMRACDFELAAKLSEEAHDLAVKLNNGEIGILADDDSPGYVLERETAAPSGTVPQWGQTGDFIIEVDGMKVRIEMEGIFGIGMSSPIPGFAAHAVNYDEPFFSPTGYRHFYRGAPTPDMTPATYAAEIIRQLIAEDLKGKLRLIEPRYHPQPIEEAHDACCTPRPPT